MKEIILKSGVPYSYKCDVEVCDINNGKVRKRCTLSVTYGEQNVAELKAKGVLTVGDVLKSYRDWLYDTIKVLLSFDIKIIEGEEELFEIIKNHISDKF